MYGQRWPGVPCNYLIAVMEVTDCDSALDKSVGLVFSRAQV